jgi:hypothetical protein
VILLVRGPDGRYIELRWNSWIHARGRHPEIAESLLDVVLTIEHPIYREPDDMPGRERLFRRGLGSWMRVVVEFSGDFDRVVTAFYQDVDPRPRRRR